MERNIVSKGKTVKEAVSIALELLNAKRDEVDIEIIEHEEKRFLGLRSRPAVVRVTVRGEKNNREDVEQPLSAMEALRQAVESMDFPEDFSPVPDAPDDAASEDEHELSGKVWVSEGRIYCKDAPDRYPMVAPKKGVKFYKNGELIEKTVVVSENDLLQVELEDEIMEPKWEVKVSDDGMAALLKVTPGIRIYRRLMDKLPHQFVELEVTELKDFIVIDIDPILDKLKELEVAHGVDFSEIARACTSEVEGTFVIARGTPPTPGKNGYFQPTQEVEIKKGLKHREDGTIDYREIQQFPSVERGQVLGVVQPPQQGIAGISVTNEMVSAPEVYPLSVIEGKGVALVENGTKAVATASGHPEIVVKGHVAKISVIPKLILSKDIDIQTGNIHYIGDVEILGSVQDAMLVETQGNIFVRENINRAKVFSGKAIIVQNNVISSEVAAGKNNLLKADISLILGDLLGQMKNMVRAIQQLSSVSAFKVSTFTRTGLGPLLKILYDGKYRLFLPLTKTLVRHIHSGRDALEEKWFELAERMQRGFINATFSEFRTVEDIQQVIKLAEELYHSVSETDNELCFIKASIAHNSELYSSGDILIEKGIYNSRLHAGGCIEVDGFVRGGEIYATKVVKVAEAGTRGGIATKIFVPKTGTIRIGLAIEDTVIQVGNKAHTFTASATNVYARLNKFGELIIE
ncbi:flagellar assembly protein A [Brevibacillus sp. GCM10020057]|uniref:flagellar assembly protein A n=1 Tax=Brevibacillus sp. GCM10020057 TaxID=3317327 RepID=UPI00363509C8